MAVEDLVAIALRAVGSEAQVGDRGLLGSAAVRPPAVAFGADAHPELVDHAAALLVSLVRNHPLVDGDERLGWAASVVSCSLDDIDLDPRDPGLADAFVMPVADGRLGDDLSAVSARWRPLAALTRPGRVAAGCRVRGAAGPGGRAVDRLGPAQPVRPVARRRGPARAST